MNNLAKVAFRTFVRSTVLRQPCHPISSAVCLLSAKSDKIDAAKAKASEVKIKAPSPKITLIAKDESVSIVSLSEAQKLAKRRDLKLVKILDLDTKTQRAIYKLMSGAEYHIEDLKRREEKKEAKKSQSIKGEKLLSLSSKISEHDLQAKLAMTMKWLQKLYEVRIVIAGDGGDTKKTEHVADTLEKSTADLGRVVQKRNKEGTIRFQILPVAKKQADPKLLDPNASAVDKVDNTAKSMHTDSS